MREEPVGVGVLLAFLGEVAVVDRWCGRGWVMPGPGDWVRARLYGYRRFNDPVVRRSHGRLGVFEDASDLACVVALRVGVRGGQVTAAVACRCQDVTKDRLDSVIRANDLITAQLKGIAVALAPEQIAGSNWEESNLRVEIIDDALRLCEDAEAAIDSGEPDDVLAALLSAVDRLAVQLRDRILDQVVASNLPPDLPL
ncbi:hypothetical protein ACH4VR_40315 [Streptomyces sp. NPDC020883]|uniref:hypothetical protein n=1 Tax=Streptomyces sp. NPDC020883 TaxID=3365099 RepID=UPI00379FB656